MEKWHIIWTNITIFHIYEESIKKKQCETLTFEVRGEEGGPQHVALTQTMGKMLMLHLFYVIQA